jgi:trigger factor
MTSPDTLTDNPSDESGSEQPKPKLNLEVTVDKSGACERHITVSISREDIDRYFGDAFDELVPRAEVRGFRAGRAPRKLVENHFREQIREQVKGALLVDSLQQISEEHEFSAISEPDFNYQAVEIPDDGPLKFEFDLEVRPDFDLPNWEGLNIRRPVQEITDEDVDLRLGNLLDKFCRTTTVEEGARLKDRVTVDLRFHREGQDISTKSDVALTVLPNVNFQDGTLEGFADLMQGAKAGEIRTGKATLGEGVADKELAGQPVDVEIKVIRVARTELPELSPSFLNRIGGFEDENALRAFARQDMERRLQYHQRKYIRQQITELLTAEADWELPPDLLRRQARRELDRVTMEMQSSGFTADEIDAHRNRLRQNVLVATERALREHFILERLAEEHDLEATEEDYELQIQLIAHQMGESPRKVRARFEKRGQMDTLRNQIVEGKAIQLVLDKAVFEDVSVDVPEEDTFPVQFSICGENEDEKEIPEAQAADTESLRQPVDRT